ncbi:redoxin family protein [Neolewinella litorea]|uniref:Redoxin domain-containing protein n=1 Tax=Neolewinella litorea TaxID=2562452 RepID=A0A4S4NRU8_9BACT|nr:redoxin family protein [Neolewinella litorea]THH41108.1 redoxin domain-containing protein [Neolewinella litorea]
MFPRLIALFLLTSLTLGAQDESYRIAVDVKGYEEDFLTLGYYLMDKQYIVDTAYRSDAGTYVFEGDSAALNPGIYLVVLSPDNNYFQFLIGTDGDQDFALSTDVNQLNQVKAEGSTENERFYDYLDFLAARQEEGANLQARLADTTLAPALAAQARQEMQELDARVKAHQEEVVTKYPEAFVSAIIRSNQPIIPPDYPEITDEEARRTRQWRWMQQHYFDGLDLSDPRLVRTPFLFQRVDYFINTLQVKHPDTLAAAIDEVLSRVDPQSEAFKFFVVHYTNEAASSNIVGMDGLYVHMVDNYYRNDRAYWADEEQLRKMIETADRLKPLLIGRKAPDLQMVTRAGNDTTLYGVDSDYTVLYFWRYDCPACKKSTPYMKDFYEKYKDRGVTIFSVCTKGVEEMGECWDYVDEQGTGDWVQVVDPYQRFYRDYDIKSTPAIFLLDKDKNIISKRIGAEQLDEVMDNLLNRSAATSSGQ